MRSQRVKSNTRNRKGREDGADAEAAPAFRALFAEFAATFAGVAGGAGASALAVLDPVASALAVGNMALYAGAYTSLKPKSEINTWVGAVVGGVPPLIGWAAAGGSLYGPASPIHAETLLQMEPAAMLMATPAEPWLLAGALYLWQFPHFFALAWVHRTDYSRGQFQMVPCNDPSGVRTANLILRYGLYSSVFPFAAVAMGAASPCSPSRVLKWRVGRRVDAFPTKSADGERADGLPHHARVSASLAFLPAAPLGAIDARRGR